jgi:hypothetical protein
LRSRKTDGWLGERGLAGCRSSGDEDFGSRGNAPAQNGRLQPSIRTERMSCGGLAAALQ